MGSKHLVEVEDVLGSSAADRPRAGRSGEFGLLPRGMGRSDILRHISLGRGGAEQLTQDRKGDTPVILEEQ